MTHSHNAAGDLQLDNLKTNFFNDKILVSVKKNCGYRLLVPLLPKANVNDLYRYVELYYKETNTPLNLYYLSNNVRIFIPKTDISCRKFFNEHTIRPITPVEQPVVYELLLDLC